MPTEIINRCYTLLAWDIERAAFLTRACYNVGYLSIGDSVDYMRVIGALVGLYFTDWKEYAVSYLLGRMFWSTDPLQSNAVTVVSNAFSFLSSKKTNSRAF